MDTVVEVRLVLQLHLVRVHLELVQRRLIMQGSHDVLWFERMRHLLEELVVLDQRVEI